MYGAKYCIVGNLGKALFWRFGKFGIDHKIINARAPMAVRFQIAKFKLNGTYAHNC